MRGPYKVRQGRAGLSRTSAKILPGILYLILALAFFDRSRDWSQNFFGVQGGDAIPFVWFLNWWPFALSHHLNPFISYYVWYPAGYNLTWTNAVPLAALLGWPLTSIAGPVFTYNSWAMIAPALSAWTAFMLLRYLTLDWLAALVGGYLFGFSSYELGQLLGHPSLDLTFLVPLAVLLCVKRANGDIARLAFVAGLTAVLVAQLGISVEIVATLCVLGAITWAIFLVSVPATDRPALWRLATDIWLAAFATTALTAPFLLRMLHGLADVPSVIISPTEYSADLLNYVVPTAVTRFGRLAFAPISQHFAGNPSEQGAYLGLPLVLILALQFRNQVAEGYSRALLIALSVLIVLSLGPVLQVGGLRTSVPLPWTLVLQLPLLHHALPARITLYVSLIASITAALYLASPCTGSRRQWRFALAGLACLFLLPNVNFMKWNPWPVQPFFTPENVRQEIGTLSNVLVLPAGQDALFPVAWQIDAKMQFRQVFGYVGFRPDNEREWFGLLGDLASGSTNPNFGNDLAAFCASHKVNYILIGPGTPNALITAIAAQHWPQRSKSGVIVTQVPEPQVLGYNRIDGDYWPTRAPPSWVGQRAVIHTHGTPSILTLNGQWRPSEEPVTITLNDGVSTSVFQITRSDARVIRLPANANVVLTASSTFVPDRLMHNGDLRALSVAVSLQQTNEADPPNNGSAPVRNETSD